MIFGKKSRMQNAQPRRRRQAEAAGNDKKQPTTGSNTKAFSYGGRENTGRMSSKNRQGMPPVLLSRRITLLAQRFGTVLLVSAALISVASMITLSTTANVTILKEETAAVTLLRPAQTYQVAASDLLSASLWNRNKVTINTAALRQDMLRKFPELQDVTVAVPLFSHRPVFYVQPAKASLVLSNKQAAYIVSTQGIAISRAQSVAALRVPSLPVITDQGNLEISIGTRALPAQDVAFIQEIIAQFARKGVAVGALTMPTAAREIDIAIAGQNHFVKCNLQGSAREQAGTYLAVMQRLKSQQQAPSAYVDVRVAGRAYYR